MRSTPPRIVCRALAPVLIGALLAHCSGAHASPAQPDGGTPPAGSSLPITGDAVPGMQSYDSVVVQLMRKYGVVGGAVAVMKDDRLVYARGFGYADADAKTPVQPDALFRIASLSKQLTSAAVLQLVERGKLGLDDPAFALLPDLKPAAGATVDPRLARIHVIDLLRHSGGWNRDKSGDPMFMSAQIASAMATTAPASAETIIRYMLGQPLDFDPGSRYAYSNFGYDVLGRILERVTGQPYESYMRGTVLAPMGITRMRIGHTLAADAAAGEVHYYSVDTPPTTTSVFPGGGTVLWPYGGFYLEAMDAHGGWIASAPDMLKFLAAVDGRPGRADLLAPATIQQMTARQPAWADSAYWYGLGWLVRPSNGDANWWHNGSLPGTTTLLVRAWNGLGWAALFNTRARDDAGFSSALDAGMWTAAAGVTAWPTSDAFSKFP